MSFPRYPKYKNSGVEWLGQVPAHWELGRVKHLVKSLEQGWSPQCEGFPVEAADQWGVLKVGCVNGGKFRPTENKALPPELEPIPSLGIAAGDLLISRANTMELVGSAAVADRDHPNLLLCDKLYRLRFRVGACEPNFIAAYLGTKSVRAQIELAATGASSSMLNIGQSTILELVIALPDLEEQQEVARFLGGETAKIDGLIAEQRRLIDLLKEKRQAVISSAVTKGVNPNARTKQSGVPLFGAIPAHWCVCAVRRAVTGVEQGWSPECLAFPAEENEWGILKTGCVNGGIFNETDNKALPPQMAPMAEYEVMAGDVLMSRANGSPELVGSTAFVEATRAKLMLSDKIFRLRLAADVDARFFVAAFNSWAIRIQIERALSGGKGLANNLPQASLKEFLLCLPPLEEQFEICVFLAKELQKIDDLLRESEASVTLLLERRSALISAAVTGQIDVRGTASASAVAEDWNTVHATVGSFANEHSTL